MSTKTIADTTKNLICVVNDAGIGLSINEILERIHVEHPGCKTTKSCVSWYLSKAKGGDLKNFEGTLPRERARSAGKANVAVAAVAIAAVVVVEPTNAEKWRDAAAILVGSEYTEPKAVKYITKMTEKLDIDAVIEAERAAAAAEVEVETEVEEVTEVEVDEDEAIPLTEEDEEIDMNLSDEELASLVA